MIIFVCKKCKYTDLFEEATDTTCPRCGCGMVSLGLDSIEWNRLDNDEKQRLINRISSYYESQDTESVFISHSELSDEGSIEKTEKSESKETVHLQYKSDQSGPKTKKVTPAYDQTSNNTSKNRDTSYASILKKKHSRPKHPIIPGFVLAAVMIVCLLFALNEQRKGMNAPPISQPHVDVGKNDNDGSSLDTLYDFSNCLYYDSISDEDREIYELTYDLVMHKDESGYSRTLTMGSIEYAGRENSFFKAYHAMLGDHPEFFYLQSDGRQLGIRTVTFGTTCTVTFTLGEGDPDENEKIARFESATQKFMNGIDLNASDAQIELQIHDKLINLVSYDFDLATGNNSGGDLGYTAYGALVEDSNGRKNKAVCGGYAQAFQYLLMQAGIESAYVTGVADSESGTLTEQGSHAWNLVKLDDEWYEVDCCWDDIDAPPNAPDKDFYKIIKSEQPQYYNATHHWYNRTTDEMARLPRGTNTDIRIQQGNTIWEFEHCSKSTHRREMDKTNDYYDTFLYLDSYLPQATGTKYAPD